MHEFMQGDGGDDSPKGGPSYNRRADDIRFIKLEHTIDKLSTKVADLHSNHVEHREELSDLSAAVTRLSNTINRAIWVIIGGAVVIGFLSSGQFTQTVKVGQAVVESQNASR